ncbi:MAG TPA: hypothetical protein VMW00_02465, partial [Dehalococcoidales bacterium]|nr:hypothetical protein [Dehalococcoidales bacterium]
MFSFLQNSIKKEGSKRERLVTKRIILTPLILLLIAAIVVPATFVDRAAAYDYTEYPGLHRAFEGSFISKPPPPSLILTGEAEIGPTAYFEINASDDIWAPSWGVPYSCQKFIFDISEDSSSISQIDILHEGYGTGGHTLYVWNNGSPFPLWEQLDTTV